MLTGKKIVITGGTGSLGQVLIRRLLSGEMGQPTKIIVFSRDEAKQHNMRVEYMQKKVVTDEVIYRNFEQLLEFRIGDVRDFHSVSSCLRNADVVFNAAALKQVPTCEYFPFEAVQTNIEGPQNIVRAIRELNLPVVDCPDTRFICVRYGNVLASRGSVIPLFHEQIRQGGPITITTKDMTRFLLSLDQAVDTIFAAIKDGYKGETYIPNVPSAKMTDLANVMIGDRPIKTEITGIRPGEKTHEILVSEEEAYRTIPRNGYYVILPILPELRRNDAENNYLSKEYSSADYLMSEQDLQSMLNQYQLLNIDPLDSPKELLR